MPSFDKLRVSIIGSGVGGLTLAHALLNKGCTPSNVRIFERSPILKPAIGAGLGLTTAVDILAKYGFSEDLHRFIAPVSKVTFFTEGGSRLAQADMVEVRKEIGLAREYIMGGAERAEVITMLANRLPQGVLQLGKTLDSIEQRKSVAICVFTDGDRVESDIVVGADGINSKVRDILFGEQQPVFSGHCIWYGVSSNVPDAIYKQIEGNVYMLFGRGCNMGTYCINKATKKVQFWRTDKSTEVTVESWENDVAKEVVRQKLGGKSEIFDSLVEHADRLMHFGLYHRQTLKKTWHKGRVVLLGDAAHATLPYMSQGANLAIEDAACLAHLLEYPHTEKSFRRFHKIREPKTTRLVNEAVILGKIDLASGPITAPLRNTMYRVLDSTGIFTRSATGLYRQNFSELRQYLY